MPSADELGARHRCLFAAPRDLGLMALGDAPLDVVCEAVFTVGQQIPYGAQAIEPDKPQDDPGPRLLEAV